MAAAATLVRRFADFLAVVGFLFWASAAAATHTDFAARCQCKELAEELPENVFLPSDANYSSSIDVYWALQARDPKPACIVMPRNTAEVADAIKRITKFNGDDSRKGKDKAVPFAIRGGGHTPWAGAAGIEGGILLDLQKLDSISINKTKGIAQVGAGQRWGNVYRAVEEEGLMVIGGRGSDIGVAGLTTGGGVSFFLSRKGYACDNVANFEVVLADGRVVNANNESNSDLFKALKGGSNNFGVVTRLDLYTFVSGPLYGGIATYGDAAMPAVYDAFANAFEPGSFDANAALITGINWFPPVGFLGTNVLDYTAPFTDIPAVVQPYLDAQPQFSSTVQRDKKMSTLSDEFIESLTAGARNQYATTTFRLDRQFLTDIDTYFHDTVTSLENVAGIIMSIGYQAVQTSAVVPQSIARGGNVNGLTPEDGTLVFVLLAPRWEKTEDDAQVYAYNRQLFDWIEAEAKKRGLYHPYVYLNYATEWQHPIEGYGKENHKFLREVSKKYDPRRVFQRQVPGGYKLWK